jgi:STAS domain-containing protein
LRLHRIDFWKLTRVREALSRAFVEINDSLMPHNNLRAARGLPFLYPDWQSISMLRIVRSTDAGITTLTVSGRISSEQLPDLRRFVEEELTRGIVLDLAEVSLVDVDAVRFLAQCESRGVRIARCPGYVREWMAREHWPP